MESGRRTSLIRVDRHLWPIGRIALIVCGLAVLLVGAGVVGLCAMRPPADLSTWQWWLVAKGIDPEILLPLIGLGIALALGDLTALAAMGPLLFGIVAGSSEGALWDRAFAAVPHAFENAYYTAAIAGILVGLALVAGRRLRTVLVPLSALGTGAMIGLHVLLTDPQATGHGVAVAGIAFSLVVVAGVFMTIRALRLAWFAIAARIAGSWLIAIGLLYGGASLFSRPVPLFAPSSPSPPSQSFGRGDAPFEGMIPVPPPDPIGGPGGDGRSPSF